QATDWRILRSDRRIEADIFIPSLTSCAAVAGQFAAAAIRKTEEPKLLFLLLQRTDVGNDRLHVVRRQTLHRPRVLRCSRDGPSKIGIRLLFGVVANKARDLCGGLARGIGAVAGCAF